MGTARFSSIQGIRLVDLICAIIVFVIFLAYFLVLNKQYGYLKEGTARVQVLATRAVFSFPIYALLILISLLVPSKSDFLTHLFLEIFLA